MCQLTTYCDLRQPNAMSLLTENQFLAHKFLVGGNPSNFDMCLPIWLTSQHTTTFGLSSAR